LAASPQRQAIDGGIAAIAGSTTPTWKKLGLIFSDQGLVEMAGRLAAFRVALPFRKAEGPQYANLLLKCP
jgi:hypothetical protein